MKLILQLLGIIAVTLSEPAFGEQTRLSLDPKVYSEEIAYFVPSSYQPKDVTEIILHLHGHLNYRKKLGRIDTFEDVLQEFKFDRMLEATGRNAILVVPSSRGKCDTFKRQLADEQNFKRFLLLLVKHFKLRRLMSRSSTIKLVLTGHSGAYSPISRILTFRTAPAVTELHLFDALYVAKNETAAKAFAAFASDPAKKFRAAFVFEETGEGTRKVWTQLPSTLRGERFEDDIVGPEIDPNDLKAHRPAFVSSDQGHYLTVNKYFPLFLRK